MGPIGPSLVIKPQAPKLIYFSKTFCTVQKSIKFGLIQALGFKDQITGWEVIDVLLLILYKKQQKY